MRRVLFSLSFSARVILIAGSLSLTAQEQRLEESAKLKKFLRDYLKDSYDSGRKTSYFAASVNLGDSGGQMIVYFTDPNSCGTGGCTSLILAPSDSSYKVITSITIGWPPIRVLSTKTNGWHDLAIWVQGGGIQ